MLCVVFLCTAICQLGRLVGYRISGESYVSPSTRVTFVTTGYLLQVLVNSPENIFSYSHVVLDEVHERGIDAGWCCHNELIILFSEEGFYLHLMPYN